MTLVSGHAWLKTYYGFSCRTTKMDFFLAALVTVELDFVL